MNLNQAVDFVQLRTGHASLITHDKAVELLNARHAQALEEEEWSRKKSEIILNISAENTTGTFAVTNGSSSAVGTGLTLSSANVGWYIQFGSDEAIYKIGAFSVATVTLHDFHGNTVTYAGETDTDAAFRAFKRWYSLGEAIEGIDSVVYDYKLEEATTGRLDDVDPNRSTTSDNPRFWAYGPRDSNGYMQIEFWPHPTGTIAVRVNVTRGHVELQGDNLPIVPWYVIAWGAAEDACLYLAAKTNQASWAQLAQMYEKKYALAAKRALEQDQKKHGLPHQIKDAAWDGLRDTDFAVAHDPDW